MHTPLPGETPVAYNPNEALKHGAERSNYCEMPPKGSHVGPIEQKLPKDPSLFVCRPQTLASGPDPWQDAASQPATEQPYTYQWTVDPNAHVRPTVDESMQRIPPPNTNTVASTPGFQVVGGTRQVEEQPEKSRNCSTSS